MTSTPSERVFRQYTSAPHGQLNKMGQSVLAHMASFSPRGEAIPTFRFSSTIVDTLHFAFVLVATLAGVHGQLSARNSFPYPHSLTATFTKSHRARRMASCYRFDSARTMVNPTASRYSRTDSSSGASPTPRTSGKSPSSIPYPCQMESSSILIRTMITL